MIRSIPGQKSQNLNGILCVCVFVCERLRKKVGKRSGDILHLCLPLKPTMIRYVSFSNLYASHTSYVCDFVSVNTYIRTLLTLNPSYQWLVSIIDHIYHLLNYEISRKIGILMLVVQGFSVNYFSFVAENKD